MIVKEQFIIGKKKQAKIKRRPYLFCWHRNLDEYSRIFRNPFLSFFGALKALIVVIFVFVIRLALVPKKVKESTDRDETLMSSKSRQSCVQLQCPQNWSECQLSNMPVWNFSKNINNWVLISNFKLYLFIEIYQCMESIKITLFWLAFGLSTIFFQAK